MPPIDEFAIVYSLFQQSTYQVGMKTGSMKAYAAEQMYVARLARLSA